MVNCFVSGYICSGGLVSPSGSWSQPPGRRPGFDPPRWHRGGPLLPLLVKKKVSEDTLGSLLLCHFEKGIFRGLDIDKLRKGFKPCSYLDQICSCSNYFSL